MPISKPPKWIEIAEKELGVSEKRGTDHNKRILEYQKATTLHATDDETPWCSAFANFCILLAGINGTHSAVARSWLNWGKPLKKPVFGCIVVLSRGGSSWSGHVGFYLGASTPETIRILGGNQGNMVSIHNFPIKQVLGYRWPNK